MKIIKIKSSIKYNAIISALIMLIIGGSTYYLNITTESLNQEYNKINDEASRINIKSSELETKSLENKKYAEYWSKIDNKKKFSQNINIDELNSIIARLADKYSITNTNLKMNNSEILSTNIYNNITAPLLYCSGEITFSAFQDTKAIQFADEFINSLYGYPIVTNFKFSKEKDYTIQDLFDISTNKNQGNISAKLEFSWYIFNPKK